MATMKVPKAVTAAALRADELLKTLDAPEVDAEPPLESIQPPLSTANEPPKPVTPAPEVEDAKYWQHRFKTTEGILNSTNRRHADELRQRDTQMASMQTQINELVTKASAVPKQYDIRQYVSPENITQYGEDLPKMMLEMASKAAQESAQETVSRVIKQELDPVRNQVKVTAEASQQERINGFWKSLQRAVPGWQEINGDPKFLTWLTERDGMTKFTRDDILKDAEKNLDSDTVIEVFSAFKKSIEVPSALPPSVQRRVLPESSISPAPMSVDEAPLFTGEQVRAAYNDYARGVYRGKLEEWQKLEKRMNEAIRSNRVS